MRNENAVARRPEAVPFTLMGRGPRKMGLSTLPFGRGSAHNLGMHWDSPLPTKLFLGAAAVVFVTGLVAMRMYQTPVLSAPPEISAAASAGGDLRDALASPALPIAGGGWFQAAGAAALGRAAHAPSLLGPSKQTLPSRPTMGRAVFSARRVIVDRVQPGVPEPELSPVR